LPKHATLSCTICSNMSVVVGALVWTGRNVSSLHRGDEEDTRCCSSVPWDRERSDEIHGVNSPSHLPFLLLLSLSLFLPSFPLLLLSHYLIVLSLFFSRVAPSPLKNHWWMYIHVYVCICACTLNGPTVINVGAFRQTQEPNRDKSTERNPVSTTRISARSRRRAFRYYRLDLASFFKPLASHTLATCIFTSLCSYFLFILYELIHTENNYICNA